MAFKAVKELIRAGDTYQVNLTFPMRAAFAGDSCSLYAGLLGAQPAAYACHIEHDNLHIVSISPERFFEVDGSHIVTRPMKGTRARGRWREEDDANRASLETSEKDRAENLMIVDLIRNDLGRVAKVGSVNVDDLFAIERYRTVWQMVSQVSGQLDPEVTLIDVMRALFPCGSVTGAPKASSMEIIADVEAHPRGVYCGALGFIPPGDGLDGASFSVGIRTAVIDDDEGVVVYGVGGGITWDSDREGEYDEALAKALVLTTPPEIPGLFETIRWNGEWLWLEDHLRRLEGSAGHYGIPLDIAEIRSLAGELASSLTGPTRARFSVDAGGAPTVSVEPAPERFAERPGPTDDVVRVGVDFDPIDRRDDRFFHKTENRGPYEMRAKRHPEWDDVLLTNELGNITESTIANVAFRIDDEWVTPPVRDGLLPGIMRQHLLEAGVIIERSVSTVDAYAADAIALFNSIRGWRQAELVDGSVVGTRTE